MGTHTFMQVSTTKKLINRICLKNEQSILRNYPKPTIYYNSSLIAILLKDIANHTLMLDADAAFVRATKVEKDSFSAKYDCTNKGYVARQEVLALD